MIPYCYYLISTASLQPRLALVACHMFPPSRKLRLSKGVSGRNWKSQWGPRAKTL